MRVGVTTVAKEGCGGPLEIHGIPRSRGTPNNSPFDTAGVKRGAREV